MKLQFHGGAGTVTGSRHLLASEAGRLLVDCGLFQGHKELRERNWHEPGFAPEALDAVVLTHAHIDHSGYLPRLVREGFRGPIFATPATADLADVMLRDAANIQEQDAEYANKKGYSRHRPALPLYTAADAERALELFHVVDYGAWTAAPASGAKQARGRMRFRFRHAGHIIGSGQVDVEVAAADAPLTFLFSGDVGRSHAPLATDPAAPEPCDYLVIESTYGDRNHPETPVAAQLRALLEKAIQAGGTLLVPAFAVGRSQQLIYFLRELMELEPKLALPIHLDSPMAIDATKIYRRYPEEHGLEDVVFRSGSSPVYGPNVFLHRTQEESMRLNELSGPRIVISSSGMMAGGRVLHHLKRLLPGEQNTVVLVGYQSPGTRGWRLQQGERFLRIHGQDVPVRAAFAEVSGLSAHADSDQLVDWVRHLPAPREVFVTHGEPRAAAALAARLQGELGFRCSIPAHGDSFELPRR